MPRRETLPLRCSVAANGLDCDIKQTVTPPIKQRQPVPYLWGLGGQAVEMIGKGVPKAVRAATGANVEREQRPDTILS